MVAVKRCLYEELGVERTADDATIRRAYRAEALANHPDKNRGENEAAAAERFKAIQHAYEVLSDPHERAWYDSHRDAILRGSDPSEADENDSAARASDLDLFSYFTSTAYDGFGDAEDSFYGVYSTVFSTLAAEERSEGSSRSFPAFGQGASEWSDVSTFYRVWEGFSSNKAFAFADKWNLADAPNRDYRRAMEKENKKERAQAKKEFNSLVRELAAFVRKRDPRVKARRDAEAAEVERRQAEACQRKEREAKERRERAEETRAQRDEALEEDAEELDRILEQMAIDEELDRKAGRKRRKGRLLQESSDEGNEDGDPAADDGNPSEDMQGEGLHQADESAQAEEDDIEDDDDTEELEDLYCPACKKSFRTEAQRTDHERSKKHKAAAAKLRKSLEKEEDKFAQRTQASGHEDGEGTQDENSAADGDAFAKKLSKKQKRAARRRGTIVTALANDVADGSDTDGDDETDDAENLAGGAAVREGTTETQGVNNDAASPLGPDADERPQNGHVDDGATVDGDSTQNHELSAEEARANKLERRQKRKQKRKEKAKNSSGGAAASGSETAFMCNVCSASFPTRNKLFKHVSEKGHALHVSSR